MNTVFVVKNSAFQFMVAPNELKMNWVSAILKAEKVKRIDITNDLSILYSSDINNNITYRIKIENFQGNINGSFIVLKNENNILLPLDDKLENHLIEKLKISKVKLTVKTTV